MTTDFCGKDVEYILSLSYGKDSLACLGAVEQLGLRIDRIIHAEIWATDTISADLPPMVEFKAKADKIIKERYGITVEHVCAVNIDGVKGDKVTFNDGFYHKVNRGKFVGNIKGFPMQQGQWCQKLKLSAIKTAEDIIYSKRKRGNRAGEIIGFPMIGACDLQTALKVEPIRKLQKNCISYIGIASDEPQRIKSDDKSKVYPLVLANWTEKMCREWCVKNDLLSPIYSTSSRGGCWFCPNQSVGQLRILRHNYPELWKLLLKWDSDSPVSFKADGRTVHDFDRRFSLEDMGILQPNDSCFKWSCLDDDIQLKFL